MQTAYRATGEIRYGAVTVMIGVVTTIMTGCISAPPQKPNLLEQARHENAIGSRLATQFESKLHYYSDPVVDRYLNRIAAALAAPGKDPRLTEARVAVISDVNRQWRSFGLPGRKIYLPLGLLRELRFDNEVAAIIAFEDGNLLTTDAIDNLNRQLNEAGSASRKRAPVANDANGAIAARVPDSVIFLGPHGIFSFDPDQLKESVRSAIRLLYVAGFDVRGLIEVWERYQENPEQSPYSPQVLDQLLGFTRETISLYAPLKDPIVGTTGFLAIRKRIEKL